MEIRFDGLLAYLQTALDFLHANPFYDYIGLGVGVVIGGIIILTSFGNIADSVWTDRGNPMIILLNLTIGIVAVIVVMKGTGSYAVTALAAILVYAFLRFTRMVCERTTRNSRSY